MKITLFGLIWLIALCYCFLKREAKYMIFITLFSMIFQSASAVIYKEEGVGPQIFSSSAMIAWAILNSRLITTNKLCLYKKNKLKHYIVLLLVVFVAVAYFSMKYNDLFDSDNSLKYWLFLLQLVIYVSCFFSMWNVRNSVRIEDIKKILLTIISFVAVIGFLQLLTTTGVLTRNIIWTSLIYTPDTDSAYYWTSFYPRVFSTFMEPSYCGAFLVGAFYFLISLGSFNVYTIILSVVVVAEIMLTFSSTAYGTFFVVGIVYLIFSKNKKALKYLIPIGVLMVLILAVAGELFSILDEVIFDKASSGSGWTRHNWDVRAWNAFEESKIIGNGYKGVRASQFFISILSQLGIVGTTIFCGLIGLIAVNSWKNRKKLWCFSAGIMVLSVFVSMLIAIPDIDYVTFWQSMYVFALLGERNEDYSYG